MPAYEIVPGDAASPVVLHVPHSSTWIPDDVRARILLDDAALRDELAAMTDACTDLVALLAADASSPRPWAFVNRASRLVVDPERFTDPAAEEMEAVGMGAVYTSTSQRTPLREAEPEYRAALLDEYFHPYAAALADLVDARLEACGRAVILDVHSYPAAALPYELHAADERPPVCLGTDAAHTSAALLEAARTAFGGWDVATDQPFSGTYVPLRHYGRDTRVESLMLEIRRDQYLAPGNGPDDERIAELALAVAELVVAAGRPSVR